MSYHAVSSGANVVTLWKDGQFRAMTCAWATMVDYDKVIMLLGSQSVTGNAVAVGDILGFSALASHQGDVAEKIGSVHSDLVDKKALAAFEKLNAVYVVKDARTQNELKVLDVMHLKGIGEDSLIYAEIVVHRENTDLGFYRYP